MRRILVFLGVFFLGIIAIILLLSGRSFDVNAGKIWVGSLLKNKDTDNPAFSIVLATYNRAAYLPRAITSVQGQTFTNFELIVVDDGSTDNTKEIVESFQKNDPRIIYIRSDKNYGASHARNLALKAARGKYISILDSDDMFFPTLLATEYQYLEENDDVTIVTVRPYNLKDDGAVEKFNMDLLNPVFILFYNEIVHSGSAMRQEFIQKYNITYDENYRSVEDYKMWAEVLMKQGKIVMLDKYLIAVRYHNSGGMSHYKEVIKHDEEVEKIMKDYYAPTATNACAYVRELEGKYKNFDKNDVAKAKFFFCSGDYSGMYFIVEDVDGAEMIFVREDENSDHYCEINSNRCGHIVEKDDEKIIFQFKGVDSHYVTYSKKNRYTYQNSIK